MANTTTTRRMIEKIYDDDANVNNGILYMSCVCPTLNMLTDDFEGSFQ